MERIFQFSIFSFFILYINGDDFDYCYARDSKPYEFFSTWTNYDAVKGWSHSETVNGCRPVYVWGIMKHGVKSFTDEQIKRSETLWKVKMDIEQNDKEKRCALCWDDFQNIHSSSVKLSLDKTQNENLARKAYSNHELFASYLGRFIESSHILTKNDFEFQISRVKGANDSAIKFANQLLRTSYQNLAGNDIKENDALLRMRSNCAKWTPSNKESDEFIPSPIFQSMRLRVSNRLGYTYPISIDSITAMYESCVFWNNLPAINKPPFCAAFLPDDLKVMEYLQDLKHYYEFGYGNPLSEKMGCALVKDMMDKLNKAASGNLGGKKGTFYVADEENIMGLITKMGLYRDDEAPKHDNYQFQKEKRKWKSSLWSPFTATMHVVLFSCNNNEKRVEFYHNQNLIKFDSCKSMAGNKCALDTFLSELKKNTKEDKCDENFCGSFPKSGSYMISYSIISIVVCFLFSRL